MIKVLKPVKRLIRCVITDKNALEVKIKNHMSELVNPDMFFDMDNKATVMDIFKRLLVKAINDSIDVEINVGYIVETMLDNDKIRFSFTKVESEKLGSGYSIALTLQD